MRKTPLVLMALAIVAVTATVLLRKRAPSSAWPRKAVTLLVPASAGIALDTNARLFADRLARRWGQPVVIDNRPAGDGILGFSVFAASRDDHTLLFGITPPITMDAMLRDDLSFDARRDFVPIAAASVPTVVIAASTAIPVTSLEQLKHFLKTSSSEHFWSAQSRLRNFFEAFLKIENLRMTYLPYQKTAEAVHDLGAGRLHIHLVSLASVQPLMQSGKVRLLAVTGTNRSAAIPTIPTVKEAGYPGLTWDGLFGIFGWRDMPEPLRSKIEDDIRAVAKNPDFVRQLSGMGQTPPAGTPGELNALLDAQRAQFQKVVDILGLKTTSGTPKL